MTQVLLCGLLALQSWHFDFYSAPVSRPLLATLAIFGAAFAAYLASIPLALRLGDRKQWIALMFAVAILMRFIMLFSTPIQEVDLYRYIWDGAVSSEGVSPYRFPPSQVRAAIDAPSEDDHAVVRQLAGIAQQSLGLHETLRRVHFGELPTVYPPVSQLMFWCAHQLTWKSASVVARVRLMKLMIVLFDIGVMLLLFKLLQQWKVNPAWSIAYGWCPLVLKEFANSGHLDSIAVCSFLAAILVLGFATRSGVRARLPLASSGVLLGIAVGAKLFPIVLAPLIATHVWRRLGLQACFTWAATATIVTMLTLAPMFVQSERDASQSDQLEGLTTFLQHWEINDLIFMTVEENLRAEGTVTGQPKLWFVVTPNSWRMSITSKVSTVLSINQERTPFLLTRLITTLGFGLIVAWLCLQTWRQSDRFPESLFLTLAWFWLLCPTQNPWYWTWALPLIPFASSRLWLLVSGLSLLYYLRFWFQYHTPNWGGYHGAQVFDFVIVWLEFAPLLAMLAASFCVSKTTLLNLRSFRTLDTL
ncbi:MAG: hypothetical protein AB8B91_15035 [Rubripirellula sp.]